MRRSPARRRAKRRSHAAPKLLLNYCAKWTASISSDYGKGRKDEINAWLGGASDELNVIPGRDNGPGPKWRRPNDRLRASPESITTTAAGCHSAPCSALQWLWIPG